MLGRTEKNGLTILLEKWKCWIKPKKNGLTILLKKMEMLGQTETNTVDWKWFSYEVYLRFKTNSLLHFWTSKNVQLDLFFQAMIFNRFTLDVCGSNKLIATINDIWQMDRNKCCSAARPIYNCKYISAFIVLPIYVKQIALQRNKLRRIARRYIFEMQFRGASMYFLRPTTIVLIPSYHACIKFVERLQLYCLGQHTKWQAQQYHLHFET